jgi:hypothetical protein
MKARVCLTSVAALFLAAVSAQGAILKSYDFTTGLGDTLTNGNDLTASGGTVAGGLYAFGANQGLRLDDALPDADTYAIEMRLRFDDCIAGWAKLLDYQDRASDDGLYLWGGQAIFFPIGDKFGAVSAGEFFTLGLERVGGLLTAFWNGTQVFSMPDLDDNAVSGGNILNFFVDDLTWGQSESFAGAVDFIRIHDDRSTFGMSPVPVPATLPLLMAGLGLVGMMGRRRKALPKG